jgi:hypothetical protein
MVLALAVSATWLTGPAQAQTPRQAAQAPVVVRWLSQAEVAGRVRLSAQIERRSLFNLPMVVRLQLPDGVRLEKGPLELTLPATDSPVTTTLEYQLRYDRVPTQSLVLLAEGRSPSTGFHAALHYRFQETTPEIPVIVPQGPSLQLGRFELGAAVRVR